MRIDLDHFCRQAFRALWTILEGIVNESFLQRLLLLDPNQLLELIARRHQLNLLNVEMAPDPFAEDSGDFHVRLRVVKSK